LGNQGCRFVGAGYGNGILKVMIIISEFWN